MIHTLGNKYEISTSPLENTWVLFIKQPKKKVHYNIKDNSELLFNAQLMK